MTLHILVLAAARQFLGLYAVNSGENTY